MVYKNVSTKPAFLNHIQWAGQTITEIPAETSVEKNWLIADRFGNEWTVHFCGNVGEFFVTEKSSNFLVSIYLCGNKIEIIEAIENGRKLKSERLLKKFENLALMVSNYQLYGLLK